MIGQCKHLVCKLPRDKLPVHHYQELRAVRSSKCLTLGTKIEMPAQQNESSVIVIRGTKEGIARAMHKMKIISVEQVH